MLKSRKKAVSLDFAEKMNLIFDTIGCTNAEAARECGIDPSLVSRYKSGSRIPRSASNEFIKFCSGLVLCAQKNGSWERLKNSCDISENNEPYKALIAYLVPEYSKYKSEQDGGGLRAEFRLFGRKLNALMSLLDVSNIRLARAINVDSSLISRFRSGLRAPLNNHPLTESLCAYLYKTACQSSLEFELAQLINLPAGARGEGAFIKHFTAWLIGTRESGAKSASDSLSGFLGGLSAGLRPGLPPEICMPEAPPYEVANEYAGMEGLRTAVYRFLYSVATSEDKPNLKLYSDQNMQWLSADPEFIKKWSLLMSAVLMKGSKIKIIHNVERNLDEMLVGIEKWLPLYMSGSIEGYYCKHLLNPRFSHTLFVASQCLSISGSFVSGEEESGVYQYSDLREKVMHYEKQIDALFKISKPLINVFNKRSSEDYTLFRAGLSKSQGFTKRLTSSLPLAAIPEALLATILEREDIKPSDYKRIIFSHKMLVKQFRNELGNGHVTEYIKFHDQESLTAGRVALDLSDLFEDFQVFYTPEEYSLHVKSLITYLENKNYDIIPLRESPFPNIHMMVKENSSAIIKKADYPPTVFSFSHPLMCRAISEYIDGLKAKNRTYTKGGSDLMQFLKIYQ